MEKPQPPDFLGTPGSKDNLNWKMLKEGYLIRHKRGRKSKRKQHEVLWFVIRQDTFVQKSRGNWQSVRLEAYSGKTLKHAWVIDVRVKAPPFRPFRPVATSRSGRSAHLPLTAALPRLSVDRPA